MASDLIPIGQVSEKILSLRGQRVMLDRDLAELYGVETKMLKRAVRRNMNRFPLDFMFEMTDEELQNWRYHFGTSNSDKMGLRYRPMVFTEQGVAMLSSVLRSKRAVDINILIMRAFVRMRELLSADQELAQRIGKLEQTLEFQGKTLETVVRTVSELLEPPKPEKPKIGFKVSASSDPGQPLKS